MNEENETLDKQPHLNDLIADVNQRKLLINFMNWVIKEEGMTTNNKRTKPEIFVDDYLKIKKLDIPVTNNQHEQLKAFIKQVAEWDEDFSSSWIKFRAKDLLKNF